MDDLRLDAVTVGGGSSLALVALDEVVLEALVQAATTDASADDVTPPLTPGAAWTPARITWLRSFHRDRLAGLRGPAGEATWAVVVDERVVGSVRLKRTDEHCVLEAGIWLTCSARRQGIGQRAIAELLQEAVALGALGVRADTTAANAGALRILQRLGFNLAAADSDNRVRALIVLAPQVFTAQHR